jgi:hypothetical protein
MTVLDAPTRNGADLTAPAQPADLSTPPQPAPVPAPVTPDPAPPATPDPGPSAEEVRAASARRHALWFFWGWLLFATVVSIGGNVIHAWMTAPSPHLKLLAAIAAAVPPAVLLGSTHSVALLIKTRRRGYRRVDGLVLGAALALTVGVAVCAFAMSFFSLRDLMVMVGMSTDIAWLWPIAVDLSLICSTLALLSLTSPQSSSAGPTRGTSVRLVQPGAAGVATVVDGDPTAVVHAGPSSPAERRLWWESIAAVIRERRPDVRKFGDLTNGQLAEILERMYDNGESGRVIVDTTILHNREIQVIKKIVPELLASTTVAAPAG